MPRHFSKFVKKIIARPILAIIGAVVIGVIAYSVFKKDATPVLDTIIIQRKNLVQEVSVTGKVKPAESVDLSFERAGRVVSRFGGIGTEVRVGQTLVGLENGDTLAQLRQTEANFKIQEAVLEKLKRGSRPEEIQIQETKVANAQTALDDAKKNLLIVLRDSYTKSDDAVRNKADQIFVSTQNTNYQLSITINNNTLKLDIEWLRFLLHSVLANWKASVDILTAQGDFDRAILEARANLEQVRNFLDKAALAVNFAVPSGNITQSSIDGYKSDISTGRTNINTAFSNLSSAEEKVSNANSDLAVQNEELLLLQAGTSMEEIKEQEGRVEEAAAQVDYQRTQFAKTTIHSPLHGVITKQNVNVGEIVTAGSVVTSLISLSEFEIEANIPEADVTKITVGDSARITLDAYGEGDVFMGHVVSVEPGETIVEGVVTYKTIFQFDTMDERIKSGMTANVDIITDIRENAIVVPSRAVKEMDGGQFVQVLFSDGTTKEVNVKTGIKGSFGEVEITEGLKEGDVVVTFVRE